MNKKILFLLLIQVYMFATLSFAQQPCTGVTLPTCLAAAEQHVNSGSDWHGSHGIFTLSPNNAPTSPPATKSLYMWSFLNQGNGAFTCFNFVKGHTYRVCFWVRNVSGWPGNWHGRLYVYAANNLVKDPPTSNVPHNITKQLIDQTYYGPGNGQMYPTGVSDWEFITTTFTANYNYTSLWLYPLNPKGHGPDGPVQYNDDYIIEVDDIRVIEEVTPLPTPSVSGVSTISGCSGQTTLTINNMPTGSVATWTPSPPTVVYNLPDGSDVTVKPCSTTTYKIEISDPTPSSSTHCPTCVKEVLYHTVTVNQWSDPANIIYPQTVVPCTSPFPTLEYIDDLSCSPNVSYEWIDPQLNSYTGNPMTSIPTATALHSGEWTLKIHNALKGCFEEHKFDISVGSCCISEPDFNFTPGINPVTFNYNGTGITNLIATVWDFGDGSSSSLANPIHTYDIGQQYTVCVTAVYEDAQGESCCKQKCKIVQPPANPYRCEVLADFSYDPISGLSNKFDFNDLSSGSGTICEYKWDFGDNSPPVITTVPTISYTYTTLPIAPATKWKVCLTAYNCIYDANGNMTKCSNTKCYWVDPHEKTGKPSSGIPVYAAQTQPGTTPFNELGNMKGLTVYPNPNDGNFTLILYKRTGSYQVVVRDKLRSIVYNRDHLFSKTPEKITLKDLPNGIYSVEIMNGKEKFVEQITIIR